MIRAADLAKLIAFISGWLRHPENGDRIKYERIGGHHTLTLYNDVSGELDSVTV